MLAFAADAGAFAALGGQDVAVAGVGVMHSSTLFFAAHFRTAGVLFVDKLSMIT